LSPMTSFSPILLVKMSIITFLWFRTPHVSALFLSSTLMP